MPNRLFKLTRRPGTVQPTSSDSIDMPPLDRQWVDRQLVHNTLGGGLPQTALQPLPAHIPGNAELSHEMDLGGPDGSGIESYSGGAHAGGHHRRHFRHSIRPPIYYPPYYGTALPQQENRNDTTGNNNSGIELNFVLMAILVLLVINMLLMVVVLTR